MGALIGLVLDDDNDDEHVGWMVLPCGCCNDPDCCPPCNHGDEDDSDDQ